MNKAISHCLAGLLSSASYIAAQETTPRATTAPPASAPATASDKDSSSKNESRPIPSFLIVGTVFNENAMSFPGVQVRIRINGEKKFRWEAYTDSRGEFAVRVPPGFEYVLVTHVRNYADQSQDVNAKVDVQQRVSIKLEPQTKAKVGTKS
jgi:hypothetical protein